MIALVVGIVLAVTPSVYVIEQPGPVFDTLGSSEVNGETVPLISIPAEKTYPTDGTLDMLTVSVVGSPSNLPNWLEVALAWFDPSKAITPAEAIFPTGVTDQQQEDQSAAQMTESQQSAIAAALTKLGYDVPVELTVTGLAQKSAAEGILESGDTIVSVNGEAVTNLDDLKAKLAASGAGTPVQLGIRRDSADQTVEVTPTESDGAVVIGVLIGSSFTFPFEINIKIDDVGGPSAGMMFALGIYDKLTPGSLTGGKSIAGTGTIDSSGTVGPIGGIRQKLYSAQRAGAKYFLAPAENCDEVVGHIPDGISVFSVKTLDDSLADLQVIGSGKSTASLATCDAG